MAKISVYDTLTLERMMQIEKGHFPVSHSELFS